MENVLVTGGAGFIGSNLCGKLIDQGKNVYIIDNFNDFYDPCIKRENINELLNKSEKESLKLFEGDIRDSGYLDNIFNNHKIDTIIHLAAYAGVRPSIEKSKLYSEVNVTGTVNMLEEAKNHGIRNFIFASSSSVYGNSKNAILSETDNVDNPISPYAATKKAGELLCYTYHHLFNINIACLRFFTVYGPGQRPDLAIHKFTKLICEGGVVPIFGDGSTERDYTFVNDIVVGIINAARFIESKNNVYEIFNLGNSNTISLLQMVGKIEDKLGKRADLIYCPPQAGDVKRTCADIKKAKETLGYYPETDFDEGLEKFIEWYSNL